MVRTNEDKANGRIPCQAVATKNEGKESGS